MRAWADQCRSEGARIALVPTMGYLHAGHLTLVEEAARRGDRVVVSIFVNPTQFAPGEDLSRYPRDFDGDLAKLEGLDARVDAVFAPTRGALYPEGFDTYVAPEQLARGLCGASRPSHFRGVCTVVLVLFRITRCGVAVLGEKDFQQLQIIRRMVADLWLDVEVVGVPTLREPDGLAMSSRNARLSVEERREAVVLSRALRCLADSVSGGERDTATLLARARSTIEASGALRIDYLSIVDAATLQPVGRLAGEAVCAVAAFVGETRLIDNVRVGANAGTP